MSSHVSEIKNNHSEEKVMILNMDTFLVLAGIWKMYKNNTETIIAFNKQEIAF